MLWDSSDRSPASLCSACPGQPAEHAVAGFRFPADSTVLSFVGLLSTQTVRRLQRESFFRGFAPSLTRRADGPGEFGLRVKSRERCAARGG